MPQYTTTPFVSILMAVYNRASMLRKSIDALITQTYRNWELIIVDDCSTDASLSILNTYTDKRIKIYKNKTNRGPYHSLNTAFSYCTGDLIAINDSDDISRPRRLTTQVATLTNNTKIGLCCSQYNIVDSRGVCTKRIRRRFNNEQIAYTLPIFNIIAHSTVMIRRAIFEACGKYPTKLRYCNDWVLWNSCVSKTAIKYISRPLVNITRHMQSISLGRDQQQMQATITIVKTHYDIFCKQLNGALFNYIYSPASKSIFHKLCHFLTIIVYKWYVVLYYCKHPHSHLNPYTLMIFFVINFWKDVLEKLRLL